MIEMKPDNTIQHSIMLSYRQDGEKERNNENCSKSNV